MNPYADELSAAVGPAVERWVRRSIDALLVAAAVDRTAAMADAIERAAVDARAHVAAELAEFLALDVDDQRTNPLAVLRSAVRFPTEVLREAGHAVQPFASLGTYLAAIGSASAGCAVLDDELPEPSVLEGKGALQASALPVVLTSFDGDVKRAVEAMRAGAVDFLIEPVDGTTLLAAVERALALDAEARTARAADQALAARVAVLSPREREVCDRVARGMLNKQIAVELGISESAVRIYRGKGVEKLGVGSAAELARLLERLDRGA